MNKDFSAARHTQQKRQQSPVTLCPSTYTAHITFSIGRHRPLCAGDHDVNASAIMLVEKSL